MKKQLIIICNDSNPSNSLDNLDDQSFNYEQMQRKQWWVVGVELTLDSVVCIIEW